MREEEDMAGPSYAAPLFLGEAARELLAAAEALVYEEGCANGCAHCVPSRRPIDCPALSLDPRSAAVVECAGYEPGRAA